MVPDGTVARAEGTDVAAKFGPVDGRSADVTTVRRDNETFDSDTCGEGDLSEGALASGVAGAPLSFSPIFGRSRRAGVQ